MQINEKLKLLLLSLEQSDKNTRAQLLSEGRLFDGYAPEMERVHAANAGILAAILDEHGWPGMSLVGEAGTRAAWIVAQNAIGLPQFQRRCLEMLRRAVEAGEAPAVYEAYLTDQIRFNERRPQVYGTIFDWDAEGQLSPWTIEAVDEVDQRRAQVGLPPLEPATEIARLEARVEGNTAPADHASRQRKIDEWARRSGWLQD